MDDGRSRTPGGAAPPSQRRTVLRRLGWGLLLAAAYLLGSVPFSYLIVRRLTGLDLRELGSGNPGATNAMRVAGVGAGVAALLCDAGKGAVAVAVPKLLGAPREVPAAAAVAVTAGHVYPAFLGLKGGKGAATGFGALAVLDPLAAVGSLAAFGTTVATTRYVSAGSMAGAATFPALVVVRALRSRRGRPELLAATGAVAALVLGRHKGNISRLAEGSERRIGDRLAALPRDAAAPGTGAEVAAGQGDGTTERGADRAGAGSRSATDAGSREARSGEAAPEAADRSAREEE